MSLLNELKSKDKKEFKKDFLQIIRIAFGVDRYYKRAHPLIDKYIPKFRLLIESFNNKYKNLRLKIKRDIENVELRIFIDEKSAKDVFSNAASKIEGLKSIGAEALNAAAVEHSEKFVKELAKVKDSIYVSYHGGDIYLEYAQREKMVEVHYNIEDISDEKSPCFVLLSYYALKDGYDSSIEVYEKGVEFGFYDLLTEKEKDEWLDKFNPLMEE